MAHLEEGGNLIVLRIHFPGGILAQSTQQLGGHYARNEAQIFHGDGRRGLLDIGGGWMAARAVSANSAASSKARGDSEPG